MNSAYGKSYPCCSSGKKLLGQGVEWGTGGFHCRCLADSAEAHGKITLGGIQALLHNRPLMEHTRSGSDILVRIDPGEEIHAALKELADDLGFDAAAITSGIGRTRENQYGYMDEEGVYQRRSLDLPSELVSLSGNIARTLEGDAFTHIHCCWSDDDNNVHAGHLFQATVHVVAEIHIRVMDYASMTRCPLAKFELLGLEFD